MTCQPLVRARIATTPLLRPRESFVDISLTRFYAELRLLWAGTGSNRRPCGFQPHALPTELPARGRTGQVASVRSAVPTGFEPATSALTGRRAQPSCSTGPGWVLSCAPSGVRIRVATLKGWCPRPLDDGGPGSTGWAASGSNRRHPG